MRELAELLTAGQAGAAAEGGVSVALTGDDAGDADGGGAGGEGGSAAGGSGDAGGGGEGAEGAGRGERVLAHFLAQLQRSTEAPFTLLTMSIPTMAQLQRSTEAPYTL